MGRIAGELADFSIITSDNPRSEDPLQICAEVEAGIKPTGSEYIVGNRIGKLQSAGQSPWQRTTIWF